MRTVHKYQIADVGPSRLHLPKGANVLTVQLQRSSERPSELHPTIWAEVETDNEPEERHFLIVGTGHPLPGGPLKYIGTFQPHPFVFHLFERTP